MARTKHVYNNLHGPKDVRVIEVPLYTTLKQLIIFWKLIHPVDKFAICVMINALENTKTQNVFEESLLFWDCSFIPTHTRLFQFLCCLFRQKNNDFQGRTGIIDFLVLYKSNLFLHFLRCYANEPNMGENTRRCFLKVLFGLVVSRRQTNSLRQFMQCQSLFPGEN